MLFSHNCLYFCRLLPNQATIIFFLKNLCSRKRGNIADLCKIPKLISFFKSLYIKKIFCPHAIPLNFWGSAPIKKDVSISPRILKERHGNAGYFIKD
jgi:hypothetical protein